MAIDTIELGQFINGIEENDGVEESMNNRKELCNGIEEGVNDNDVC